MLGTLEAQVANTIDSGEAGGVPMLPGKRELLSALRDNVADLVRAEVDQVVLIAGLCEAYSCLDSQAAGDSPEVLFGERLINPGADGTPQVAEFFTLELGPALGVSPESALQVVADVMNLRHRLPITWEQALAGKVRVWVARKIAQVTSHLSYSLARELDSHLGPSWEGWTPGRIFNQIERWITLHDTDAKARREQALANRYVHINGADPGAPGIAYVDAAIDTVDAAHLDATLNRVADTLRTGGMVGPSEELRAVALGKLAHPVHAAILLGEVIPGIDEQVPRASESATGAACRHGAELIIRTTDADLAHGRGGELERFGALTREHLAEVLANCAKVTVRPVVDLTAPMSVSTYQPSPQLYWKVKERDRYELFPFSNRSSRSRLIDEDHTIPAAHGGETSEANLACLSRRVHRARTFAGFTVEQTAPGVLHWTTPAGQQFWTSAHGTWNQPPPQTVTNDPDTTTTQVLARLLRILAARPAPPLPATRVPIWSTNQTSDPNEDPPPF